MEKKKVKAVFGSLECMDRVNGLDIKFITGANLFRVEPHDGKNAVVISERELLAIAEFTKGFRVPKLYTEQELDRAREEGKQEMFDALCDSFRNQKKIEGCPHVDLSIGLDFLKEHRIKLTK